MRVEAFLLDNSGDSRLTRNFKVREFKSRNESQVFISPELVEKLQELRDKLGEINVNSGYRTTAHNKSVCGSKNSAHLIGLAADISSRHHSALTIAKMAEELFGKSVAIGLHDKEDYVHIDVLYRGNFYRNSLDNKVRTFLKLTK